jgi:hypothetical protein
MVMDGIDTKWKVTDASIDRINEVELDKLLEML